MTRHGEGGDTSGRWRKDATAGEGDKGGGGSGEDEGEDGGASGEADGERATRRGRMRGRGRCVRGAIGPALEEEVHAGGGAYRRKDARVG